jgi:polyketide biosynthesis enoyl-CoA hydratase PksI
MSSAIIAMQEVEPGVMQLTMQDRARKNALTPEMTAALQAAFTTIAANRSCKVLVITGYDSYFCSGGTREGLLALHEGRGTFADTALYGLPLNCEIPVIAAMQGHAIGGGLVFGLCADIVMLSRESLYTANFMRYGFTPGMGATAILPHKLGAALGTEMLLGARSYRGAELEKRGVPFEVLKRELLPERVRQLASEIAAMPRAALVTLKTHLVSAVRARLPEVIAAELRMHAGTIHSPEVRTLIGARFGGH